MIPSSTAGSHRRRERPRYSARPFAATLVVLFLLSSSVWILQSTGVSYGRTTPASLEKRMLKEDLEVLISLLYCITPAYHGP